MQAIKRALARLARYPLVTGFAAVALVGSLLPFAPFVTALDLKAFDQQSRFLRAYAPSPVENDVVAVGIDEETTRVLREPIALWHPHLGAFFQAMA